LIGVQFAISPTLLPVLVANLRSFKPDVVHAHNLFFRTTELAAALRIVSRTPLVTTLHLGEMTGGGRLLRSIVRVYESTVGRCVLRKSDRITAVSRAVATYATRRGAGADVAVIPNGVDATRFAPGDDEPDGKTVLFVGRLVPNKGPDVLLRALPSLVAAVPDVKVLLAGDGPMRGKLTQLADALGVADVVEFLGHRSDIPELMKEALVFVRPSTLEGLPLTVLEAMSTGIPVVATPVGGTPEIVLPGRTGYVVPVGDHEALSEGIVRVLKSPDEARQMGVRARDLVMRDYTWDRVVDRTEQLYLELLAD
jgi:glycosyltransferase involved in cell wall biosynthesis